MIDPDDLLFLRQVRRAGSYLPSDADAVRADRLIQEGYLVRENAWKPPLSVRLTVLGWAAIRSAGPDPRIRYQ
jgi:hypothetical protein